MKAPHGFIIGISTLIKEALESSTMWGYIKKKLSMNQEVGFHQLLNLSAS